MRGVRFAVIAVLGLPLAGCLGVTMPPKELPEWAMQPQAADIAPARQRTVRWHPPGAAAQRAAPDQTAAATSSETMPFTPEWTARENAADDRLRRRMHICGGC